VTVYSRIQSSRLYEQIVEQIEQLILDGKLHPGDQLPSERELAEQFDVSRTAVREAVKALQEKGLVEIETGRGTFITHGVSKALRRSLDWMVRSGDGNRLADLVQVRNILEPEIAALAAEMASGSDIERLEQAVNVMDSALNDADVYVEADQDFHLALASATQNQLISTLIDPIVDLLREQRKRIFLVEGGAQRGQYHHKRILEAVKKHDRIAAREAMQAHLAQVRQDSEAAENLLD
jgi:GntR family transcriptional repressor for pyruvate dehydrogenase complex